MCTLSYVTYMHGRIHVSVCVYVYIYLFIYMHMYIYIYIYIFTHLQTYTHLNLDTHVHYFYTTPGFEVPHLTSLAPASKTAPAAEGAAAQGSGASPMLAKGPELEDSGLCLSGARIWRVYIYIDMHTPPPVPRFGSVYTVNANRNNHLLVLILIHGLRLPA